MSEDRYDQPDRATALRETLLTMFGLGTPSVETLRALLQKVAPEDVAAVLGDFSEEQTILLYQALPSTEAKGIVLEETDQQSGREILEALSETEHLEVLGELSVDDLADHLENLPDEARSNVLAKLEDADAERVEEVLRFGPDSAGRMMTTEFISIPEGITSRAALEVIQGNIRAEVIAYVYVLDAAGQLCGVASIRGLLAAKPDTPVRDHMTRDPIAVSVDTDREEVAALVDKYNLSVLPVVDHDGVMRGIVTFDDIIDAVQEEHSEDMLRMAGTVAIHPFYEPVHVGVAKRLPFLLLTMLGGLGFVLIKTMFDGHIAVGVMDSTLALVPLMIALSGNVAIVSSTIMVRGLATGDINLSRLWKALGKEVTIGALIGLVLAVAVTVTLLILGPEIERLPYIAAMALCGSILVAAVIGASVPILCRLTGKIDPAIASGPFVTMLCDVSASFLFLLLVYLLV